jgi:transposase-like protein
MTLFIKPDDLPVIETLAASKPPETIRKRVRLMLLYEAGMKTDEIARKVKLSPGRVLYWRRRYLRDGLGAFGDAVAALTDASESAAETKGAKAPKRPGLRKLTRRLREAHERGEATDGHREALEEAIALAQKRHKKLRNRLKGLGKKKAARAASRLKKLEGRIKRAKKVLRKLAS